MVLPLETLSFWSLVLKLRELAAGWRVAQGRHLMVPELSSGAPGAHRFLPKGHCRILSGFGPWRIFGALGGTHGVPSHSEVVFEIAGNRRSRKRPQSDLGHNGSPQSPKSPTRNFHRRRQENPTRISMVAREAVAGDDEKCFRNQQESEGRNPTVLPLETLSFCSLVL